MAMSRLVIMPALRVTRAGLVRHTRSSLPRMSPGTPILTRQTPTTFLLRAIHSAPPPPPLTFRQAMADVNQRLSQMILSSWPITFTWSAFRRTAFHLGAFAGQMFFFVVVAPTGLILFGLYEASKGVRIEADDPRIRKCLEAVISGDGSITWADRQFAKWTLAHLAEDGKRGTGSIITLENIEGGQSQEIQYGWSAQLRAVVPASLLKK